MVIANPPLAEPVIDPGGVTIKPPFEMGVANFEVIKIEKQEDIKLWLRKLSMARKPGRLWNLA